MTNSNPGVQSRTEVKALLERHGVEPDRRLGQHFLADPNITRKIAALARIEKGQLVLEVGPGTGTLTSALEAAGAVVTAIELDDSLGPILEEVTNATVVFADAARLDLNDFTGGGDWIFVSNLPYNVGTSILLDALRHVPTISRFVVMVQVEVADRLVAPAGSKTYGIPSVVRALHGVAKIALRVPPQVFVPPPRVGSAVVVVERRPPHPLTERAIGIATIAFNQRRKMLRKSLAAAFDLPARVCEIAGIQPTARPEELEPAAYIRLAEAELSPQVRRDG